MASFFEEVQGFFGGYDPDAKKKARRRQERRAAAARAGLRYEGGRYYDMKTGKDYGSNLGVAIEMVQAEREAEATRTGRVAEFQDLLGQYRTEITEAGEEMEELAKTRSARQFGTMTQQLRNVLMSQGTDPEKIQAILAGGQEQQARSLQDLLAGISAQTQQQLAGATQLEVGTGINLEELGLKEESLQQSLFQFLSGQAEQRRQFEQQMAMQPTGFEQILGLAGQGLGIATGSYLPSLFTNLLTGGGSGSDFVIDRTWINPNQG